MAVSVDALRSCRTILPGVTAGHPRLSCGLFARGRAGRRAERPPALAATAPALARHAGKSHCRRQCRGNTRRHDDRPSSVLFQRKGATLYQRFGVRNGNIGAVSRWSRGLGGIFEIVAAAEAGGGRMKKETRLRGDIDCRSSLALSRPCREVSSRHPLPAEGAKGQGPAIWKANNMPCVGTCPAPRN